MTHHRQRIHPGAANPMTHRTRAQERADEIDISPTKLLADMDKLKNELDEARKQSEEYLALLQRERAEFNNYRRRTAEERERELGLAGEDLIRKVLALADDLDRAIEARPESISGDPWVEGITAIDRKLRVLLESEGVSQIEATRGIQFDPREHDAIANVPDTELRDGQIVEELRRGYRLRDRVIRPALVAVAESGAASAAAAPHHTDTNDEPTDTRND
jgi:molecular chaperone GrpE